MIGSSGHFLFDGCHVCNQTLGKPFCFRNYLLQSVYISVTTALPECGKDEENCKKRTNNLADSKEQLEAKGFLISVFKRTADSCSDRMPYKRELRLQFSRKAYVYDRLDVEYARLYSSEPSTEFYFIRVCRTHCHNIKIRNI